MYRWNFENIFSINFIKYIPLTLYSGIIFWCKDLPHKARKQEGITATLSWDALCN